MQASYTLTPVLNFLKKLSKNNNKEWFTKNKDVYQHAYAELIIFADALLAEMNKHDTIETPSGKKSLYRIYNDVRFSKDKSLYKNNLGGGLRRATKLLRGGYYYHIEPGNSFVAGGFFSPNAEDLLHIRQHLSADPKTLTRILNQPTFRKTFGSLIGEKVKTAPRGFDVSDPAIELIRHKQFIIKHTFTDQEVSSPDFHKLVSDTFKKMRPYLDYMSEILTTDLNGESVISSQ
ncbi:MAG: DUF2461 domain-containing protein [Cytophaga sp.]|uniref:DUF2461 domain-containing protein n=1 Tax=Cytophaga sp. TaxID=29535 RepID=UPI003F80C085